MNYEEFKEKVFSTFCKEGDKVVENLEDIVCQFDPTNEDVAQIINDAYDKGVRLFMDSYFKAYKEAREAKETLELVKEKVFNDYINQIGVRP